MPATILDPLRDRTRWQAACAAVADERGEGDAKVAAFIRVVESGEWEHLAAAAVAGRHRFAPACEVRVNRRSESKKRVFRLDEADELLCRVANGILMPLLDADLAPQCHSFRPGHSARTAFLQLRADPRVDTWACLRLDVRDFFNSIPPGPLIEMLPQTVLDDPAALVLIRNLLGCGVRRAGTAVTDHHGVLPGTPLAPLLANLYLRDLDVTMAAQTPAYARYSDDIIVLGDDATVCNAEQRIRSLLGERGLTVNETKTGIVAAGEPWDFLGFRYHRGSVGVSANTARKFRARTRRLARRLDRVRRARGRDADSIITAYLERMNRRLYGGRTSGGRFCWSTWFFPVLTDETSLRPLDESLREQARFAASGAHRLRNRRDIGHERLRALGHLPLTTAYHVHRSDRARFSRVVAQRTGRTV